MTKTLIAALLAFSAGTSQATLIDRGGGLIYDDVLNITWLQDANYAKTSGYDPTGVMTWDEAMAWADQLVIGNYTDWRLPRTVQPDSSCDDQYPGPLGYGANCTGSELGYLFYINLGGNADSSILASHNSNFLLFENVKNEFYWSETEYLNLTSQAWDFYMSNGYQYADYKFEPNSRYAWAVRDGDVAATNNPSPIPEPSTLALLLIAGLGLFGFRFKYM